MKLISCDNCGLVYDAENIQWPEVFDENGFVVQVRSRHNGCAYVPVVECHCGYHIDETGASYP